MGRGIASGLFAFYVPVQPIRVRRTGWWRSRARPGWSGAPSYDGDGVRLSQVVNGQPITYTLDLAAPLVTVLAEAQLNQRTTYVYGLGDSPLASDDGAAWTYLSGRDALNSVRQETDAAGQVLAARSFDPYGVPLSGDGGEPFGYTGEYRDSYIKLQWLRARWLTASSRPLAGVHLVASRASGRRQSNPEAGAWCKTNVSRAAGPWLVTATFMV